MLTPRDFGCTIKCIDVILISKLLIHDESDYFFTKDDTVKANKEKIESINMEDTYENNRSSCSNYKTK